MCGMAKQTWGLAAGLAGLMGAEGKRKSPRVPQTGQEAHQEPVNAPGPPFHIAWPAGGEGKHIPPPWPWSQARPRSP